jgi:hypothetical protein
LERSPCPSNLSRALWHRPWERAREIVRHHGSFRTIHEHAVIGTVAFFSSRAASI